MIRVTITGRAALARTLRRLPAALAGPLRDAIAEGAEATREKARANLRAGRRSGRIYQRGGKLHQASAPGELPKSDTESLADSIFVETRGFEAEVGSDLDYAKGLEFGTRNMAARPWLLPSFEMVKPGIASRVRAAVGKAVRDAAKR